MDLSALFRAHPAIRLFDPGRDEGGVHSLFDRFPMRVGGIELFYDRSPHFSRLLECQGPRFLTLVGELDGKIRLVASVSIAKRWVRGVETEVASVGDFRSDGSAVAAKLWRRVYPDLLSALTNTSPMPLVFLTAVLGGNEAALANLVRPRRNFGVRYVEVGCLKMVNIFGCFPWTKFRHDRVRRAQTQDSEALRKFLIGAERSREFGYCYDDQLWQHRQQSWDGFRIENFLVQTNAREEIVACTLPWDPGFAKRMTVGRVPFAWRSLLWVLRWCGLAVPSVGQHLETLYLTHLHFGEGIDRAGATASFLAWLRASGRRPHFVSFADDGGIGPKLRGWIRQRVPVHIYRLVVSRDEISSESSKAIHFEMGLV